MLDKYAFQYDAYRSLVDRILQYRGWGWVGSAQGGGAYRGGLPHRMLGYTLLWTEFLTYTCENIAFPQLLLRAVNIELHTEACYDI